MTKAFSFWRYKYLFIGANLALLLTLIHSACNGAGSTTTANSTASRSASTGNSSTTTITGSAPQVKLGTQPCPEAVKDPTYWNSIVGAQANVSKVDNDSCANLVGNSSLQALIAVRYDGAGQVLDIYVYNNITDPNPTQIFKLQSLYKGIVKISGYNTLLT